MPTKKAPSPEKTTKQEEKQSTKITNRENFPSEASYLLVGQ